MGTTRDLSSRRAVSTVPLLLVVAVVACLTGVVPGSRAGAADSKAPPGDPPGNNGTVKIERDGPNSPDRRNEPHVDGCIYWVEFYGFDQAQTADITFTSQAPTTPKGKVLLADKSVTVSDTPAGGGQDRDYVIAYNLSAAVQGLKEHPKQGYHIKLTSDTQGQPGGAKQKVFWIKCKAAPTTALRVIKATRGAGTGPFQFAVQCNHRPSDTTFTLNAGEVHDVTGIPAGTTCAVTEAPSANGSPVEIEETPATGPANDGVVTLTAGTPVTIVVTNVLPGEGGVPAPPDSVLRTAAGTTDSRPGSTALGENQTRPAPAATLPRTGGDPRPLATTGLWALGAGGLALMAGRRRRRA